jgi:hypothetical protein
VLHPSINRKIFLAAFVSCWVKLPAQIQVYANADLSWSAIDSFALTIVSICTELLSFTAKKFLIFFFFLGQKMSTTMVGMKSL